MLRAGRGIASQQFGNAVPSLRSDHRPPAAAKSDRLHVTPATFNELRRAVDVGCEFLEPMPIVERDRRG